MIVAIDGPAGAGKSTVARELARQMGYQFVDTGAMYRAVAFEVREAGVATDDAVAIVEIARSLDFEFRFVEGENTTFCNGKALNEEIRSAEVSRLASIVSAHPEVREVLVELQRKVGRERSSVLEGRDIGTVVFPDAELKVFITASAEIRARRRCQQMREQGLAADYQSVLEEIIARDKRDMERDVAPLVQAEDAIGIDSSERSVEDILAELRGRIEEIL